MSCRLWHKWGKWTDTPGTKKKYWWDDSVDAERVPCRLQVRACTRCGRKQLTSEAEIKQ